MNKKLPTNDITNELAGSSVFFQPSTPSNPAPKSPKADDKFIPATPTAKSALPPDATSSQSSNQATMVSHHRDTTNARNHEQKQRLLQSPKNDKQVAANLGELRKAVKQLGKEAATHRFTSEEKRAIADLVYTYHRQGYRTSENEITRIAVNWILLDFKERGEQSVLARLLELLHS